jgi:hypothetical protein
LATANERRPGTQPEFDWKGGARARRTFIVDLAPKDVPRDGSLAGLPGLSESHPNFPNMRVDQVLPTELEGKANYSDVEVLYSSNRQFTFPTQPLDPTRNDFNSWTISFEDVITEIPVVLRRNITIPSPNGQPPTTQAAWAYGPQYLLKILETRALFTYRFVLQTFDPGMWTAIHAQVNKLHVLDDGKMYRFRAGDIVQTTETAWESSYTWEFDGGTYSPLAVNGIPVIAGSIIYPPGLAGSPLIRLAHTQWATVDPTTPNPQGNPNFLLVEQFELVANGWQTLPGI